MSQTGVYVQAGGGSGGIQFLGDQNNTQVAPDGLATVYVVGEDPLFTFADPASFTIQVRKKSNYRWHVLTDANPYNLAPDEAFVPKNTSQNIFTLPATANVGDTYKIVGYGNLWKIQQNAGQKIVMGTVQTTPGVSGYVQATVATDQIEIVCVTPNTEFYVIQVQGNPSFN